MYSSMLIYANYFIFLERTYLDFKHLPSSLLCYYKYCVMLSYLISRVQYSKGKDYLCDTFLPMMSHPQTNPSSLICATQLHCFTNNMIKKIQHWNYLLIYFSDRGILCSQLYSDSCSESSNYQS